MELLTPGVGLIFWQVVVFLLLFFLLSKMAWKPILSSLKERENSIQEALNAAAKAKEEMAKLQADNEKLLRDAREEREKILKEARETANKLHDEAQANAKRVADKMIEDAKAVIHTEKQAALKEVKVQVAMFSLDIAEKLLKKNLAEDKAQKELVDRMINDLKLN